MRVPTSVLYFRACATISGLAVTCALVAACAGSAADDPAAGQTDDGTADGPAAPSFAVELFAPGVVSSALPEFATSFTPSGDTVFFNRTTADRSRIDLLYSVRAGEGWSEPRTYEPLDGVEAIDPFVSLDGRYLYVSAELPSAAGGSPSFDIWRLDRSAPSPVPVALPRGINSDSSDVFNSISRDGRMVFSSRRDGVRLIYETAMRGDGWEPPTLLTLGDGSSASNPAISADGALLVFAREVEGGSIDLWVACRTETGWGDPTRLPEPINSDFTEFAPGFAGEELFFSSERPGVVGGQAEGVRPPGDIYRTSAAAVRTLC